ncbi:hypothetical protein Tco_0881859 [Tanacetum coccineum]
MDDPNITMKEYIRLKEEKARKRGEVFNWETYKYGKIWYDEDVLDLRSAENEFPAIVFNDSLTSNETLFCEPTVSSLNNNELDFRISFDEFDDADYTNEFPAIVYNDALTSKSDFSTEPTLCPQRIDKFDLNDETSLSEYDEVEQSILYFNDLFPFNIVNPDDLKSDKGTDENKIDMIQSSRGNENANKLLKESHDMALPPRDQRHQYLRYEGLQYTDADIADFETKLARIYKREIHRVQVINFGGLPDLMAEGLSTRMLMEYKDAQGQSMFTNRAWRRLFDIRGPLVYELILEFFRTSPSYTFIRDPMLRLCHRLIACSIAGRSQAPKKGAIIFRGQYVARLAKHFGLLTKERLQGLTVIATALPIIDMAELVRLQLYVELDDTWASVPTGPARQEGGVGGVAEEAPGKRIARLEEEVHDMREALQGQREVLDRMAHNFSRTKTGSKFSTIIREYVTEPSKLSKSRVELRGESDFKYVKEGRKKSNLKTSL